jgi:hypothetical protein
MVSQERPHPEITNKVLNFWDQKKAASFEKHRRRWEYGLAEHGGGTREALRYKCASK